MKNINKYIKESIATSGVLVKSKNELIKTIKDSLDKGVVDLNFIGTSKITDMSSLFYKGVELAKYDKSIQETIDISEWDTSNVNNMSDMFAYAKYFNCDLSKFDTTKVKSMDGMFYNCEKFNCDLSNWDVDNVETMRNMFNGCLQFNSDLSDWNVTKVDDMDSMFEGCTRFEGNGLEGWDVSNVQSMDYMFMKCLAFNVDLSDWNVSEDVDQHNMFTRCQLLERYGNLPDWWIENPDRMDDEEDYEEEDDEDDDF